MAITRLRGFAADRSGAVAIEYAVLVSGIALTLAMTVSLLGDRMVNTYSGISAAIIAVDGGPDEPPPCRRAGKSKKGKGPCKG